MDEFGSQIHEWCVDGDGRPHWNCQSPMVTPEIEAAREMPVLNITDASLHLPRAPFMIWGSPRFPDSNPGLVMRRGNWRTTGATVPPPAFFVHVTSLGLT